ncbi:RXT2-like protein [Biscogniauxia mediterranea]|nr:RXT2-like protein [Biscogniauxia mediterranea]
MASQQVLFAETIIAMKKALKRKAYESDSDSDINHHGNRGHKLKKRARFVREGQLAPPSGPEVYKEIVNHAGYRRAIISRNPPVIDDEGYELDSEDDEEHYHDVAGALAEFNPYANVRLESILAPLTSVTDLPTHPTLSRPYLSKTLTELAKQSCDIMQKENAALWKVKHLQTKLVGDHIWAPCELMLGPNDIELYRDDYMEHINQAKGSVNSDVSMLCVDGTHADSKSNGQVLRNGEAAMARNEKPAAGVEAADNADISMMDAEPPVDANNTSTRPMNQDEEMTSQETERHVPSNEDDVADETGVRPNSSRPRAAGEVLGHAHNGNNEVRTDGTDGPMPNGSVGSGVSVGSASRRHQTKREGDHSGSRPMSVTSEADDLAIHPFFLAPRSAHPDRDLGIPEKEAEDMRRLLQLYVQKQEEICRGSKQLYEGILRANRMRKTVFQWSKYEAHCGPNRDMSDGEDWYDKEEWGLEEDLKKGQDEEEEDTQQTTKKTRTRR